jgi:hypothetical protein
MNIGQLRKKENGWFVQLPATNDFLGQPVTGEVYPLHPKQTSNAELSLRDTDGEEVVFELVKEYIDDHTNQIQVYAKIVQYTRDNLDFDKLESKLDDALSKETPESLTTWMNDKRNGGFNNDLFYNKQVMNPYPTGTPSHTGYEKGFTEGYEMAKDWFETEQYSSSHIADIKSFEQGYNKAREYYKYTEKDMTDFANWCRIHDNSHKNEVWFIQQLWDKYKNQ